MNKKIATLIVGIISALALVGCSASGATSKGDTNDFYNVYEDSTQYKIAHVEKVKFSIPLTVINDFEKNGTVKWDSLTVAGTDYLISEMVSSPSLFSKKGKKQTADAMQKVLGDAYTVDAEGGRMMIDEDGNAKAIFPLEYNGYSGYISLITKGNDAGYILAAVQNGSYTLSETECEYMIKSFEVCDCSDYSTADPMFMYPDDTTAFYGDLTGADDDEYVDIDDDYGWGNDGYYDDDEYSSYDRVNVKRVGNDYLGYVDVPADFTEYKDPAVGDYADNIMQYLSASGNQCISITKFDFYMDPAEYAQNIIDTHSESFPEEYSYYYGTYFNGSGDAVCIYLYYDTTAADHESIVYFYCFTDAESNLHVLSAEGMNDEEADDLAGLLLTYNYNE